MSLYSPSLLALAAIIAAEIRGHVLGVRCPHCGARGRFEVAHIYIDHGDLEQS